MAEIFKYVIFSNFAMAMLMAVSTKLIYPEKSKLASVMTYISLSSALWSFSLGVATAASKASIVAYSYQIGTVFIFVYFGMVIYTYLITCEIYDVFKKAFYALVLLGGVLWIILSRPANFVVEHTFFGNVCNISTPLAMACMAGYFTFYSICAAIIVVYVFKYKANVKRIRIFTHIFIWSGVFTTLTYVVDGILSATGYKMPPVVGLLQFYIMLMIFFDLVYLRRNELSVKNMGMVVFSSMATPVLVYDKFGKLVITNKSAAHFLDIEDDKLNTDAYPINGLFEFKDDANPWEMKVDHHDYDGVCIRNEVPCLISVNRVRDNHDELNGYIVIIADRTEQERAMQQIIAAKKAAEAANQAKSDFLANMSHEIRTPMNAISGFSELMLKMEELPEQAKGYTSDIRDSAKNLLAIINDVLDLAKIESGKMELVENSYYPRRVIQDLYSVNKQVIEQKGLKLVMDIDPNIPDKAYGDRIKLRSMLMNIFSNAVKYTSKGQITFKVQIVEKLEESVKLRFSVTDTGIGIKESEIERLFNSFEQVNMKLHEGIEGTGLGLSIVKGYTDLMGGTIDVQSEFGKGSTFSIEIVQKVLDWTPIGEFKIDNQGKDKSSIGSFKVKDIKGLVVDDNMVNLRVAEATLKTYGLQMEIANSGAKAIELCKANSYDMVFMDQMMPQMDGIEAMHHIREISDHYKNECKVVVLTANAISGAREELLKEGFDEYLGKPMNYGRVEAVLKQFVPEDKIEE